VSGRSLTTPLCCSSAACRWFFVGSCSLARAQDNVNTPFMGIYVALFIVVFLIDLLAEGRNKLARGPPSAAAGFARIAVYACKAYVIAQVVLLFQVWSFTSAGFCGMLLLTIMLAFGAHAAHSAVRCRAESAAAGEAVVVAGQASHAGRASHAGLASHDQLAASHSKEGAAAAAAAGLDGGAVKPPAAASHAVKPAVSLAVL
jgi:hypothetical protein